MARFHPGWESAVPYFTIESEGAVKIRSSPVELIDQAGFCAIHLFEALDAVHVIFEDAPFGADLERLHREIMVTAILQRRELGLPVPPELEEEPDASTN